MKLFRRSVYGVITGVLFALLMGRDAAASTHVAAGVVIYVDDDDGSNNGSVKCSSAIRTIAEGLLFLQSNATLYICPGNYVSAANTPVNGFTNVKIIGMGSPTIKAGNAFTGDLFKFTNSTNVTVQGLVIDGQGNLGAGAASEAIVFEGTTGTIQGNTITQWHVAYPATPTVPVATTTSVHGIVVKNLIQAGKVNILKNAVYDTQDTGILVYNVANTPVTISGNRVVFSSVIIPDYRPGATTRIQAGIAIILAANLIAVSGNQVISDADLYPQNSGGYARGILLYGASGVKVMGNTVRGTSAQISIESWCDVVPTPADNNLISGNKLYDTYAVGVYVTARTGEYVNVACGVPHATGNKITGNTIYTLDLNPLDNPYGNLYGVFLETQIGSSPGATNGEIRNTVISGNTIAGFDMNLIEPRTIAIGGTQNVISTFGSKNKFLAVPPTGIYK
jgi:hypothetical protein